MLSREYWLPYRPYGLATLSGSNRATMHVRRAKGGDANTHPLLGDELRALRELKRSSASPFVFASERGGPFTTSGFAKLLERAGEAARIGFKVHPHSLRHACGYALANNAASLPRP